MWDWPLRRGGMNVIVRGAAHHGPSARALLRIGGGACLIAMLTGCRVYNDRLISASTATDTHDTQPAPFDPNSCQGGECWWSILEPDGCRSAGAPTLTDRPSASADGPDEVETFYLGLTQVRIGSTDRQGQATDTAWEEFGLDLDGSCTNSSTCGGNMSLSCRSAGAAIPYDGQLCRDNTFARLQPVVAGVPELGERFGLSEEVFNCALWRGSYNMVFAISGYNGKLEDSNVRVDFYRSTGLQEPRPWTCPATDFRTAYPRWRTSLKWHIDASTLTAPVAEEGKLPESKFVDPHAYVKHGYLVAQLPDDSEVGFAGEAAQHRGFLFKAQHSVFVGHLVDTQDGTWSMRDGLVAGRIRKQDLVQAFREIGFCEDGEFASFYRSMVGYVDENADILASGEVNPKLDCDALSYGISFEAAQLTPGASATLPKKIECCLPGKTDEECSASCGDGKVSGGEACDTAIADGQAGACPKSCTAESSCMPRVVEGSACSAKCVVAPITTAGIQDDCCPPGADSTTDRDCAAVCGNGVLEGAETCEVGHPCPTCTSSDPCTPMRAVGKPEDCNVRCEPSPINQCQKGDGCCPAGCSNMTDGDCLASCGNGTLDPGETCEKTGSAKPCPTNCDDANACTLDATSGSAANCNVQCTHTPITQAKAGDGCCPTGATANNDSDCPARCGNGVIEPGETCEDGNQTAGDGCQNCKMETQAQICKVRVNATTACGECSCNKCTSQLLACQGAMDANDAKVCGDMVDCARSSGCRDTACLCGTTDVVTCALAPSTANGPCIAQVYAAGKTMDPATASSRASSPNYPLGRANMVGSCVMANCASECGL